MHPRENAGSSGVSAALRALRPAAAAPASSSRACCAGVPRLGRFDARVPARARRDVRRHVVAVARPVRRHIDVAWRGTHVGREGQQERAEGEERADDLHREIDLTPRPGGLVRKCVTPARDPSQWRSELGQRMYGPTCPGTMTCRRSAAEARGRRFQPLFRLGYLYNMAPILRSMGSRSLSRLVVRDIRQGPNSAEWVRGVTSSNPGRRGIGCRRSNKQKRYRNGDASAHVVRRRAAPARVMAWMLGFKESW